MSIVVVGSLNIDRFSRVARLPRPGETVSARESFTRFGGKGANQAVAAARLGGSVAMIGAVGADESGAAYRRRLVGEHIDAGGVLENAGASTGAATIAVDDAGENFILVDAGANGRLAAGDVRRFCGIIENATVVVLQLEVPLPAVLETMRIAAAAGVAVVFNPSPWRADFPWREMKLHSVIVNEGEAAAWLGAPRFPTEARIERLIVTQGAGPTLGITADATVSVAPPKVQPVDTVGAGDAFAGAYAVALAEGQSLGDALRFANAAGALATQRAGAQEALPDRRAVAEMLGRG
jgi:ribokinase